MLSTPADKLAVTQKPNLTLGISRLLNKLREYDFQFTLLYMIHQKVSRLQYADEMVVTR
jgi:hypothetical protein